MITELNRWARFLLYYWLKGDMYLWDEAKAHKRAQPVHKAQRMT